MDEEWIGRRLMQASRALAARLSEPGREPGAMALEPLAAPLTREIGRALVLGETDPKLPLLRTRLLWRVPSGLEHRDLAVGFNAFGRVVRRYLHDLPGVTVELDRFVIEALRHAARTLLVLRHALIEGLPTEAYERAFGGTVLVAHPRARTG